MGLPAAAPQIVFQKKGVVLKYFTQGRAENISCVREISEVKKASAGWLIKGLLLHMLSAVDIWGASSFLSSFLKGRAAPKPLEAN